MADRRMPASRQPATTCRTPRRSFAARLRASGVRKLFAVRRYPVVVYTPAQPGTRAPRAAAMLCRVSEQDSGPLAAARRLREAAEPHLISVQPPQGRGLMLSMALRCYRDALRAQPSAAIAFEGAMLAMELGRIGEAEVSLRGAIRLAPRDGAGYQELGRMLHGVERNHEAAAAFRSALRRRSLVDRAATHGQLADALLGLGEASAAHAEYTRGLALAPSSEYLLAGLSNQQSLAGRNEEAVATARLALWANPSAHAAQYNLGVKVAALGRSDEAEHSYRRALTMQPTESAYYQGLGMHLHGLGRASDALPWYEAARALMAAGGELRSVDLEYDVATAYREAGRLDEAVEAARGALELQPGQPEGRVLLEAALREAGRDAEARVVSTSAPPAAEQQQQPRVGSTHVRKGSVEVFLEVGLDG